MFSNLYVNAAFQGPDNNQDVEAAIANGYRDAAFQGSDNVITGPKAFGFGYRGFASKGRAAHELTSLPLKPRPQPRRQYYAREL